MRRGSNTIRISDRLEGGGAVDKALCIEKKAAGPGKILDVLSTRFANLVIDTADILASADTPDGRWWAINRVARMLGANAVNAGAFQRETREIAWVRSSMDPGWLDIYAAAAFHEIDPLLRDILTGAKSSHYDFAARERELPSVSREAQLLNVVREYDYNYMIAHTWFEGDSGKGIALSCIDDPRSLFGRGTDRAFSAISAMMAVALLPPGDELHEGWAYGARWQGLTHHEREVLAHVANGLPEYLIAEAMRVTEFEVGASSARHPSRCRRARRSRRSPSPYCGGRRPPDVDDRRMIPAGSLLAARCARPACRFQTWGALPARYPNIPGVCRCVIVPSNSCSLSARSIVSRAAASDARSVT